MYCVSVWSVAEPVTS